jgi:hypothetical protein
MHGVSSVGIVTVEFTADLASGLRCAEPTILCVRTVGDVFRLKVHSAERQLRFVCSR